MFPDGTQSGVSAFARVIRSLPVAYALFENEFRLSRTFPTATDVWRCAEDCGLVIDDAHGRQRLDEGYAIRPCPPDVPETEASERMMEKNST